MAQSEGTVLLYTKVFNQDLLFEDVVDSRGIFCTSPVEVVVTESSYTDPNSIQSVNNEESFEIDYENEDIVDQLPCSDKREFGNCTSSHSDHVTNFHEVRDVSDASTSIICESIDSSCLITPDEYIIHDSETVDDEEKLIQTFPEEPLLILATDQEVEDEIYIMQEGETDSVTIEMLHTTDQVAGNSTKDKETQLLEFLPVDRQIVELFESPNSGPSDSSRVLSSPASPANYSVVSTTTDAILATNHIHSIKNGAIASVSTAKSKARRNTMGRIFHCSECNKTFSTNYSLGCHMRIHTGETPYHCTYDNCSKKFKMSGDLSKHIRSHTGERPFICDICSRGFTTCNILKVHYRIHTGERPYACSEAGCSKRFASITNFRNHMRIHKGEKPYACSHQGCGKRFTEYSSLYKHQVVHVDRRNFQCSICSKSYRQETTLRYHERTVHGSGYGTSYTNCSRLQPKPPRINSPNIPTHFLIQEGGDCGSVVRLLQVAGDTADASLLLLAHSDALDNLQCVSADEVGGEEAGKEHS